MRLHLYCNTPPICIAVLLGKSWWLWSPGCSPNTGASASGIWGTGRKCKGFWQKHAALSSESLQNAEPESVILEAACAQHAPGRSTMLGQEIFVPVPAGGHFSIFFGPAGPYDLRGKISKSFVPVIFCYKHFREDPVLAREFLSPAMLQQENCLHMLC